MLSRVNCRRSFLSFHSFFKQPELCATSTSNFASRMSFLSPLNPSTVSSPSRISLLKIRPKSVIIDKSNYKLVYDFPLIKLPVAFSRSKIWIPALGFISAPFLMYFDETKYSSLVLLVSSTLHFITAWIVSKQSQNIVGKIYVKKDGEFQNVLVSSIDDYGRRIDRIHNPDIFINCDFYSKISRRFGFIRIGVENSDLHYKINVRNCKVYDEATWNYLFGNTWT